MKRIILIAILASSLASCSTSESHDVRLKNGSIIKATDNFDRSFKKGDTVCIEQIDISGWEIDNSGKMRDTLYWIDGMDSVHAGFFVKRNVGIINN
jgi:hypothetical protein